MFSICFENVLSTCFENMFPTYFENMFSPCFENMFSTCFENMFSTCFENMFQLVWKHVFNLFWKHVFNLFWKHLFNLFLNHVFNLFWKRIFNLFLKHVFNLFWKISSKIYEIWVVFKFKKKVQLWTLILWNLLFSSYNTFTDKGLNSLYNAFLINWERFLTVLACLVVFSLCYGRWLSVLFALLAPHLSLR